jgi:hypothetical protein
MAGERGAQDRRALAAYIGKMAGELRGMATRADMLFLAYLLAMVEEDALSGSKEP